MPGSFGIWRERSSPAETVRAVNVDGSFVITKPTEFGAIIADRILRDPADVWFLVIARDPARGRGIVHQLLGGVENFTSSRWTPKKRAVSWATRNGPPSG